MEENPLLESTTVARDRIRAAIETLSRDDLYRLNLAARSCLLGTEFRDPGEVIHEAVARAMEGSRHWPHQRVHFVPFIIMTMMSIADASRKSPGQAQTEIDEGLLDGALSVGSPWATVTASPEETQIELEHQAERHSSAAMDLERINRHFENDRHVLLLITYLKNGKAAREICADLRWTGTDYATVRKRLRRGLAKVFRARRPQ